MKKLGFGCMRLPLTVKGEDNKVNRERSAQMFDEFLREGFTYFDTAYMYHRGTSENIVGERLCARHERKTYLLADKMPVGMVENDGDVERIFADQKKKCGVEYFDYYLLHCLNKDNYEKALKFDIFSYLQKKREEGEIIKLGFSFHDTAEVLEKILTEQPQMEFVQLQINYLDWEDKRVQSRLCYETARKHGKDIIVMEPVKGGELANVPQCVRDMLAQTNPGVSPACFAIGFCASLDGVICVLSGMSDEMQLRDNMDYMKSFVPFSDKDYCTAEKAAQMIRNDKLIPCTACQYCVEGCSKRINIPELFTMYNEHMKGEDGVKEKYREFLKENAKPEDCIGCGKCEKSCPQKIGITEKLKTVEKKLG